MQRDLWASRPGRDVGHPHHSTFPQTEMIFFFLYLARRDGGGGGLLWGIFLKMIFPAGRKGGKASRERTDLSRATALATSEACRILP